MLSDVLIVCVGMMIPSLMALYLLMEDDVSKGNKSQPPSQTVYNDVPTSENMSILQRTPFIDQLSKTWICRCANYRNQPCALDPYIPMHFTNFCFVHGKAYWELDAIPLFSGVTYSYPDGSEYHSTKGTIAILDSGELLASPYCFQHCRLTHRKNVVFAGQYQAHDGVFTFLNCSSEDYGCNEEALNQALKVIEFHGVDVSRIHVDR